MPESEKRIPGAPDRRRNRRTAWIALSIAAAFFLGVILKRVFLG